MDCSPPGFPVHYQLPELAQTHVHQVGNAIQPSHPLSSPSPATHSGTLAWKIPWAEAPGRLQSMGLQSQTLLSNFTFFFSSCLQSFPTSGFFPMSHFFASGGQSTRASASASVLPINIWGWFPLIFDHWFDLFAVQGSLDSLVQYHNSKASVLQHSALFLVQLSPLYMTTGKIIALTIWNFVGKVMSLLSDTLSRFVIAFLPRSNCLLMSWCSHRPQWF